MKALFVIPLALTLAACNTTNPAIVTKQQIVILPDTSLYNCPTLNQFPNPNKLTDVQVARVIVNLYKNNQTCKNSILAIQKFLEESKRTVEGADQQD